MLPQKFGNYFYILFHNTVGVLYSLLLKYSCVQITEALENIYAANNKILKNIKITVLMEALVSRGCTHSCNSYNVGFNIINV